MYHHLAVARSVKKRQADAAGRHQKWEIQVSVTNHRSTVFFNLQGVK
jgi:hypothetical protein